MVERRSGRSAAGDGGPRSRRHLTMLAGGRGRPRGPGTREQGSQPSPRRRRPSLARFTWLLALVGLLLAALIGFWVSGRLRATTADSLTAVVQAGQLPVRWSGRGLLIHEEEVQVTPVGGRLTPVVAEGTAVRVGTEVATIQPEIGAPVSLRAEVPGAVSFRVDGLEPELIPRSLPWLDGDQADAAAPGPGWVIGRLGLRDEPPALQVAGGAPVFKVVNPQRVWLALAVPSDLAGRLVAGQSVSVAAEGTAGAPFQVTYRSAAEDGQVLLVLRPEGPFSGDLLTRRFVSVNLLLGERSGWLLPRTAVDRTGAIPIVRRERLGQVQAVPVEVLVEQGDRVLVRGDLAAGESVLLPVPEPVPGS